MKGHLRSALLLALVAGVLISPVVGTVLADGHDTNSSSPSNERLNASAAEEKYTIDGLRQLGEHRGNSPPSVRPWGKYGQFYLRHVPSGLGIAAGDMDMARYVEPDTVIRRDTVHVGSFRGWNSEEFNGTVNVVVWDIKKVKKKEGNTTRVVDELDVIATSSEQIQLVGGDYDTAPVRIPPAYNDTAYVTIWIDGHREQTQWVAKIDSSTASQSVGISSLADAVGWGFVWLFLPLMLTTAGMIVVDRKVLEKAGRGPAVGALEYAFFTCAALFLGGFVFYNGVIETLAEAPYLLGVVGGVLLGLFAIWAFSDRGKRVLFLQFRAADGNAAADGSGNWHLANRVHTVVERKDGKKVVPREGWLPFLARLWPFYDAAPLLEFDAPESSSSHRKLESPPEEEGVELPDDAGTWERIRTRFWGSSTEDEFDEVYLVDPMADDVIEYEKESFELTFPQLVHWPESEDTGTWVRGTPIPSISVGKIVAGVLIPIGAYFAGSAFFASSKLGGLTAALAGLLLVVRPSTGAARVRLSVAHYDAVIANMVQHLEGYSERADAEHFQRKYHESEAKRRASRKREDETRDHNVFRELSDRLAPDDGEPAPTRDVTEAPTDD